MCGDEVAHAKPDPEIYRRALALSGDIPEEVVVIEDSPHGVQAARLAGIRTIGLAQKNDAKKLLVAGADATVRLWDPLTGDERGRFKEHDAPITCVATSGSGQLMVTGGNDHCVRLWSASD